MLKHLKPQPQPQTQLQIQLQTTTTQHVMMILGVYYYIHTLLDVTALGCLFTTFAITQFLTKTMFEPYDKIDHKDTRTLFEISNTNH